MTVTDVGLLDNPALQAWTVDAAQFPPAGTMPEILEFCLRYAVLAPSSHNTQPWWFAVDGESLVVGMDPSRGLAVVDPDDREAIISVGAAVFMLRTALGHFGFGADVSYWPDPHDPEACVKLVVTDRRTPDPELDPLFDAITNRHTSRSRFLDVPVPNLLLEALVSDARAEGAELHILADYPDKHALAELVSDADRAQMDDKRFRRELASWMRSAYTRRPDGIRGYGSDLAAIMSFAGPLVVRTFDVGEGRAARDVDLATGSPVLAVLTTAQDDRTSWLRAGQSLARVILRATAANLRVGFLDQPIESPTLRPAVASLVHTSSWAQIVLRIGYGDAALAQPRRDVDDALIRR